MKKILFASLAMTLTACATGEPKKNSEVGLFIEHVPKVCVKSGEVTGSIVTFGAKYMGDWVSARNDAKERASQIGSNWIKKIAIRDVFMKAEYKAEAFKCPESDYIALLKIDCNKNKNSSCIVLANTVEALDDPNEHYAWMEKECLQNRHSAICGFAVVQKNRSECTKGNAESCFNAGSLLVDIGDEDQASEYYRRGCFKGNQKACESHKVFRDEETTRQIASDAAASRYMQAEQLRVQHQQLWLNTINSFKRTTCNTTYNSYGMATTTCN